MSFEDLVASPFESVSPWDHRYAVGNPELYHAWSRHLSEAAFLRLQLRVEAALVAGLEEAGVAPAGAGERVAAASERVTPEAVAREEERTRHNIRALVNCLAREAGLDLAPWIHLGATSADITETARSLQYRESLDGFLLPQLQELLGLWVDLAEREAATPQIGRTHGQHAVPVTFGFAVALYVERLGERIERLREARDRLVGKLTGAVGAYNALSLLVPDPEELERRVLARLGLEPAPVATQILPPEPYVDLFHGLTSTLGVLANFADDMRHLQRSEIAEVAEAVEAGQVGSSTMPHKRNPWNFEHVKSLWKAYAPRMTSVYLDQISEHQRDLTNSASSRFLVELLVALSEAAGRLIGLSRRLRVDRARMASNLELERALWVAEPLYVLLAKHGHPAAHEAARLLAARVREDGLDPLEALEAARAGDPRLDQVVAALSDEERAFLREPGGYRGRAEERARAVAARWRSRMAGWKAPA
ncbi:lyase family protein [Limnochorda pilosa]|uniref:Adenylosuccinate lyase n=1 Tax=Limnochorda pilosa TaxID=1555112 RepID=A0A0K2SK73_LIMPI|nr:lyase family protein [Limnochorda pilosa]BAS27417.1 adenylosuccinate lyase [Limnochorda pilosa]